MSERFSLSQGPAATSRAAVASLVLGLLSPLLALLGSVPALVLGTNALRAINAADGRLGGRRMALAGLTLGAVVTVLSVLGIVALVVLRLAMYRSLVSCTDNLRAIGLALDQYHDTNHNFFPTGTVVAGDLPPERRLSWLALVLPYLDRDTPVAQARQKLAAKIDFDRAWDDPANTEAVRAHLGRFRCPATRYPDPAGKAGLDSYIGSAGVGLDAPTLAADRPRAGFFGYDRAVGRKNLTRGISFTMAAVESEESLCPWAAGGPATVRGLAPDEEDYLGVGRPFGGLHADGANVLWADGSARMVRIGISPADFRRAALLKVTPAEAAGP